MEKGKTLLSAVGSFFAFAFLALIMIVPGAKADAALTVTDVNYENSTITVQTDSNDTILYFSDSKQKKWETATSSFASGSCVMDISWVSTTKNYVISFKGDQSTDIIEVTIPKQVTKFKAKYKQATGLVTFTGADSTDIIEYRKNNTNDKWTVLGTVNTDQEKQGLKDTLQRLCENGASVYFRIQPVEGTSADLPGKRPSKEVACKINKKSAAPSVTIDTATSKITVKAGWEWRTCGTVEEKSGMQYISSPGEWNPYNSEQDISVFDFAPDAKYNKDADSGNGKAGSDVYIQFRKSATSSSQLSYITTVKIPGQEAPPKNEKPNIEYTSTTTFKLSFSNASSSQPYEYCFVEEEDLTGSGTSAVITDIDSVTWKSVSSAATVDIKKADAPDGSYICFRKKAIGKTGDDSFKLASDYVIADNQVTYPTSTETGTVSGNYQDITLVDGVCTTNNTSGHKNFTIVTRYNTTVQSMVLSMTPNTKSGDGTATVTSTVKKDTASGNYIINATITNIALSTTQKNTLDAGKQLDLYAYIVLKSDSSETLDITSTADSGIRIHITPRAEINTTKVTSDKSNEISVERLVGSTTAGITTTGTAYSGDDFQYEYFWFEMTNTSASAINSVYLGNYELSKGTDYTYDDNTSKFLVNLAEFEDDAALYSSYGTKQELVINLANGQKLTDVTVKLIPPISLNSTYVWAFTHQKLQTTTTKTTVSSSGATTSETVDVNSYSVGYQISTSKVNGVGISRISVDGITLSGENILYDYGSGTITFSNALLNEFTGKLSSTSVVFDFTVYYTNGTVYNYVLDQGCYFTIM